MTFPDALRLAVKNSYPEDGLSIAFPNTAKAHIVIDPLFWQALGKALNWTRRICVTCGEDVKREVDSEGEAWEKCGGDCFISEFHPMDLDWLYYWHGYIDALAAGEEEQFWEGMK